MANKYHCAVIGGGLAGLCLSIQLADRGLNVVLFEKNQYPFHKVCGEYISMESWDFLSRLGLPLTELSLPRITQLGISSERGFLLEHPLGMGGFGISRYSLDHQLCQLARQKGVHVLENCKVNSVISESRDVWHIHTTQGIFQTEIVCGSYGKYTPSFISHEAGYKASGTRERDNYIGVKYHIKTDMPVDRIELHNFKDGYCGVSKVDQDWYCLCYLTTARNLTENGKDIHRMERNVLYKNPFLKDIFTRSAFVSREPLVISNVHFGEKQTSVDGVFLLGDAAGSITPLCGNGMSMGMRASVLLADQLYGFFEKDQKISQIITNYRKAWNGAFKGRITAGYHLQNLFGKQHMTHYALKFLDKCPVVTTRLISLTHGSRF